MSTFYRIIAQKSNTLNGRTVEHIGDYSHYRVTSQPLDSDKHNPDGRPIVFDTRNFWKFVEVRPCPYVGTYDPDVWCPLDNVPGCGKCPKHPSNKRYCPFDKQQCTRESPTCAGCKRMPIYPACPYDVHPDMVCLCCRHGVTHARYCPECGRKL